MSQPDTNPDAVMDWRLVELYGGPPCFGVASQENGLNWYCARPQKWAGHGVDHEFVSLEDLLTAVRKEARAAAFRDAFKVLCPDCAEGDEPMFSQQARWYYHREGNQEVGCSSSKLRIEAAANDEEGGGDG